MIIFYSPKTNGFYLSSMKESYQQSAEGWPQDAVEIDEKYYRELFDGQAEGKTITADDNGLPTLVRPAAPSQEQLIATANERRNALLNDAAALMSPLQDAVDIADASDDEQESLTVWKKYRVSLNRLDLSLAPDIDWPLLPE